ncbi:uncharacterized protein [Lepeophtheirus salmonis]|nr:uncharacterized protein LOC121120860 [Lepeophtheirus salmonis]
MRLSPPLNDSISVLCNERGGELCTRCVNLNPLYNCGWCHTLRTCSTIEQCGSGGFLQHGSVCPYESILGIFVVLTVLFIIIIICILVIFIILLLDQIALLIKKKELNIRESILMLFKKKESLTKKQKHDPLSNLLRKRINRMSQISCELTLSSTCSKNNNSRLACETSLIPMSEGEFYIVLQINRLFKKKKNNPLEEKKKDSDLAERESKSKKIEDLDAITVLE